MNGEKSRYTHILFDLDGTLSDPKEGITGSVQYALKALGIDEPDADKLEPFIGPPLKDSFQEFYGLNEEQADFAVKKYRERFKDQGIFENTLYPGMKELLKRLNEAGCVLAVASSKPEVFVNRILNFFGIGDCFKVVVGSELDGTRSRKEEMLVSEALGLSVSGRKCSIRKHRHGGGSEIRHFRSSGVRPPSDRSRLWLCRGRRAGGGRGGVYCRECRGFGLIFIRRKNVS